jgi:tetratricopeptide (TPR) repeat protein
MSLKADELFQNGLAMLQAGHLAEAEVAFGKVLRRERTHLGALNLLGIVLTRLGRFAEAETNLAAALKLNPNSDATLFNYAVVLKALQRPTEALARFDQALVINPGAAETWNSRGAILNQLERYDEAITSFDKATALRPDYADAFNNKARALEMLNRDAEALEACDQAIARNPQLGEAWFGRGAVLLKLDRHDDALRSFERAAAINPGFIPAKVECGTTLLSLRRFREGWQFYQWRTRLDDFPRAKPAIEARIRAIHNRDELAGKTVAVIAEQGVGDEIMFGSVLPDLVRDATAVTYELDPRLIGLFSHNFPSVNFVARRSPEATQRGEIAEEISAGDFDVVMRAGNLGLVYRPDTESFPRKPYLKPRTECIQRWRGLLGAKDKPLRIGISWRGGTKTTGSNNRSTTLEQMRPLLERTDCQFVSLQYGAVADEIDNFNRTFGGKLRYFPKQQIDAFEELGGLIEALDLVVSVQNTTVHLCGALDKTCLAMLSRRAEWRYGASGKEMAWYSSVELYRQSQIGDWTGVLEAINRHLNSKRG